MCDNERVAFTLSRKFDDDTAIRDLTVTSHHVAADRRPKTSRSTSWRDVMTSNESCFRSTATSAAWRDASSRAAM
jgi:hypothetical protein